MSTTGRAAPTTATTERHVEYFGTMTEADWRQAHTLAGESHPGRFKEWVGEHAEGWSSAGYGFTPTTAAGLQALIGFLHGLPARFVVDETIRKVYP